VEYGVFVALPKRRGKRKGRGKGEEGREKEADSNREILFRFY